MIGETKLTKFQLNGTGVAVTYIKDGVESTARMTMMQFQDRYPAVAEKFIAFKDEFECEVEEQEE